MKTKEWQQNIQYMKGIGPAKAALLGKLGIFSIGDLITYYPKRYEDRRNLKKIADLADGQWESFRGTVLAITENKPRRGMTITKITLRDESGCAQLVWFNQPHRKRQFKVDMEVIAAGRVKRQFQIEVQNPEVESIDAQQAFDPMHTGRIVPVYLVGDVVRQPYLRALIRQALAMSVDVAEVIPPEFRRQYALCERSQALQAIHFPENQEALEQARQTLVFEELYVLQCALLLMKKREKMQTLGTKHAPSGKLVQQVADSLPFILTKDQQQVLTEISNDMEDGRPMQRLVQGDVGSGKTVVAALALTKTVENGYQGAMMAPTEILAEQHYTSFQELLAPHGIRIGLLTGRLTRKQREGVLNATAAGDLDIVIGTHALIQETVTFKHLGLVVTDEQHRFGVEQRAKLKAKGRAPDVLVMTATPIPRTMALTVYGDLDVSAIRELPPGRKPIRTFVRNNGSRAKIYEFIRTQVQAGRQAYVVCPLIEESEKLESQAAVSLYEELVSELLPDVVCGLVHGKMKQDEKDRVMGAFYQGQVQVLVATTVIEVGVNVPNATVMLIEGAERFGLAQLHQLRGRIGRGAHQSYCILLSDSKNEDSKERLEIMTKSQDGFVLAEEDLRLRGPGEFFGTRQHGLPDLKIADILRDTDILLNARRAAGQMIVKPEGISQIEKMLKTDFAKQWGYLFDS